MAELFDVVELAYLRDALKNGLALNIIEGLAQTADNYSQAISCLRQCYDKPRLIHRLMSMLS